MGYIDGTAVLEPFAKLVGEIVRRYEKTDYLKIDFLEY